MSEEYICDVCKEDYDGHEIMQCSMCGSTIHNECGDDWHHDPALFHPSHRSGDVCVECYPHRKESPYYSMETEAM